MRDVALEVLLHGPISRSEVARRLHLSAGSLTRLTAPLVASGLLAEVGEQAEGRVGRPSQLVDVVPGSRRFVGIKVMAGQINGVVTDLRANVLATRILRLDDPAPQAVARSIAELVALLGGDRHTITAIGVGVGGLVDEHGKVRSSPFLDWQDVPLGALIEAETHIPAIVENDLIAFTEYEHWFGAGRGLDRFAVITLGAGIGYGLVIHDKIVRNDEFGIGLVGHWPLDPFGPVCSEGHRGCAKAVLTDAAVAQAVSAALARPVGYQEALDLAEAGEPAARRVVDDAGRGLGRLLAAVANLTMPQMVVLGGEGVRLAEVARDAVDAGLRADRDPRIRPVPLTIRSGDNVEWCRGAAVVAIQTFVLGHRTEPIRDET